jgi:hypothetical protein
MRIKIATAALYAALVSSAFAAEGDVPKGVSGLDHVFLIMMENHGFSQIVGNPNAPFINQEAKSANYATNYYAVGHPSSTNYLEVVGGSNFGVRSDDYPNWHSSCTPNLLTGIASLDTPASDGVDRPYTQYRGEDHCRSTGRPGALLEELPGKSTARRRRRGQL